MSMRRLLALTVVTSSLAWNVLSAAVTAGQAQGSIVVSKKATSLKHAYVTEKSGLLKIILSDGPLNEVALNTAAGLSAAASEKKMSVVAIQLDEDRKAEEAFFFHPKLPGGLSVRELTTFRPTISNELTLGGRVAFNDSGFSFSYDATFLAPISKIKQRADRLPANATSSDHARWRLKQMEIPFDEENFRDRIFRGDADAVKLFLEAGMPVETAGALADAVERGQAGVARVLIAAKANVNARDDYGQSLVMRASSVNKPEIMKLLIDAGADVNIENNYKIGPLAGAAEQGQLEIVRLLLAGGAKVNARNTYGGTALAVAVIRGYKDVVRVLLDAGADVQRDKATLLEAAKEHPEIRLMIEQALKKRK